MLECVSVRVWLFAALASLVKRKNVCDAHTHTRTMRARQLIIASVLCPPKGHKQDLRSVCCACKISGFALAFYFLSFSAAHFGFLLKFRWTAATAAAAAVGE